MHYGEHLRRHAIRRPGAIAVADRGREFTYSELDERVNRLANALLERGLDKGDRVAVLADNGHVPLELMLAACKAGFIHVPLDFRLTSGDIAELVDDCKARALVVDEAYVSTIEVVRQELDSVDALLSTGRGGLSDSEPYETMLGNASTVASAVDVEDADGFCILYTSGTTGRAKGVYFSHEQSMANAMTVAIEYEISSRSRYLVSYPHNSAGSINHVFGPVIMLGGTLVLDDVKHFRAERYFSLIEQHRVTNSQIVPTMVYRILESQDRHKYDLSSLETVGYASAPIPPKRVAEMLDAFGPIFVQGYGMTETASIATILSKEDHEVVGTEREGILASCGRATYGVEVRVVDDNGVDVKPGEVGEIAMRGRWITDGYWNDPERTAEAIRSGWLYSGDLARIDDEEYVYLVDRKKDIIITGGANVASTEVEATLYSHPAVMEAAVIGVPDEQWGERVHAVVTCKYGHETVPQELIDYCQEQLAHFKCPKTVDVRDSLPKTSTGKLAKARLREEYRNER